MSAPVAVPAVQQRPAVEHLTVLYDADCALCRWVREWLEGEALLVPLEFVPCGSPQARRRFPQLDHERTVEEITVVSDEGAVWVADGAWIVVLWATRAHRGTALRLSGGTVRRGVRAVALSLAASRRRQPAPAACPRTMA